MRGGPSLRSVVAYIGYAARSFRARRIEHMGLSILTTKPISGPEYSQIRNHSEETNHPVCMISIVGLARDASSLTIL